MSLPTVFANLPSGNNPAALLDNTFNAVAFMGVTQCAASGTNTIALTQNPNQTVITTYNQGLRLGFFPANLTTDQVQVDLNSIGAVNLYEPNGVQANSGDLLANTYYEAVYNSTLAGFQLITSSLSGLIINLKSYTANDSYVPTPGMVYCIIEAMAAGGGGGGGNTGFAAGGGAGAYSRLLASAATIGASQSIAIGASGAGGASGANGTLGGSTTVGALITCTGGVGGLTNTSATAAVVGTLGGSATGGDINVPGGAGGVGLGTSFSGFGGNCMWGEGGPGRAAAGDGGSNGGGAGAGGSGGAGTGHAGGAGANGRVVITEFIIS